MTRIFSSVYWSRGSDDFRTSSTPYPESTFYPRTSLHIGTRECGDHTWTSYILRSAQDRWTREWHRTTHGVRKTPYGSRGSTRTRAVSFHHSHRGYCWSLSTRILSKNVIHTRRRVHGESTLHIKIHLENTLLQAINPTLFSHVFLIIYSGLRSSHTVFISIFLRKYLANIHHTSQRNIW